MVEDRFVFLVFANDSVGFFPVCVRDFYCFCGEPAASVAVELLSEENRFRIDFTNFPI